MIKLYGKTIDEQLVIRGTYAFYETYGIPLDVLFEVLKSHKCIPDWIDFVKEAKDAGMNISRIISKLDEAITDSYGSTMRDVVIKRIEKLS